MSRWIAFTALLSPLAVAQDAPPDLLQQGFDRVEERFLYPDRIEPLDLLIAGAEGLEDLDDAVVVRTLETGIEVTIGTTRQTFATEDITDLDAAEDRLREMAGWLQEAWPASRERPTRVVEAAALDAVLQALDPHSKTLEDREIVQFRARIQARLAGIGARIGRDGGRLTIRSTFVDSPARTAGLLPGDEVISIDQVPVGASSLDATIDRIRGEAGTVITLGIRREGEVLSIAITRGLVRVPSVTAERFDETILLKVDHFSTRTAREVRDLLDTAGADAEGVILDLRGNRGGSMLASVGTANLFVPSGPLVRTEGWNGKRVQSLRQVMEATRKYFYADLPIVVLVNDQSASGSEIVAAGLRFSDRGLLIGEQTYGKGTVQQSFRLSERVKIKLTVARYLLPGRRWIHDVGVTPDVAIGAYWLGAYLDLPDTLPEALPTPAATRDVPGLVRRSPAIDKPNDAPAYQVTTTALDVRGSPETGDDHGDPALALALAILEDAEHGDRSHLLQVAAPHVEAAQASHAERLSEALAERGIPWSPAPGHHIDGSPSAQDGARAIADTPLRDLDVQLAVPERLTAGENQTFELTATNRSSETLHHVRGSLRSRARGLSGVDVLIGDLAPGESRVVPIETRDRDDSAMRTDRWTLDLIDSTGLMGQPLTGFVQTEIAPLPRLTVSIAEGIRRDEPTATVIEVPVQLSATEESGPSKDLRIRLVAPTDEEGAPREHWVDLPELAPGESKTVTLGVMLPPKAPQSERTFELLVDDRESRVVPIETRDRDDSAMRTDRWTLDLIDSTGLMGQPLTGFVQTEIAPLPRLTVSIAEGIRRDEPTATVIEVPVQLSATEESGPSKDLRIRLVAPTDEEGAPREHWVDLPELAPGESKTVTLGVMLPPKAPQSERTFELLVDDRGRRWRDSHRIRLGEADRYSSPVIALGRPLDAPLEPTENETLTLRATVSDPDGLRDVTVSVGGDRQQWFDGQGMERLKVKLDVPLEPGSNIIRIRAVDAEGSVSNQRLQVYRDASDGTASR